MQLLLFLCRPFLPLMSIAFMALFVFNRYQSTAGGGVEIMTLSVVQCLSIVALTGLVLSVSLHVVQQARMYCSKCMSCAPCTVSVLYALSASSDVAASLRLAERALRNVPLGFLAATQFTPNFTSLSISLLESLLLLLGCCLVSCSVVMSTSASPAPTTSPASDASQEIGSTEGTGGWCTRCGGDISGGSDCGSRVRRARRRAGLLPAPCALQRARAATWQARAPRALQSMLAVHRHRRRLWR